MRSGVQEACRCPAVRADPHPRRDALIRRTGSLTIVRASSRQPRPPMHDSSPAGAYGHRRRFANARTLIRGSGIMVCTAPSLHPPLSRRHHGPLAILDCTADCCAAHSPPGGRAALVTPTRHSDGRQEGDGSASSHACPSNLALVRTVQRWTHRQCTGTLSPATGPDHLSVFDPLPRSTCLRALVHWVGSQTLGMRRPTRTEGLTCVWRKSDV